MIRMELSIVFIRSLHGTLWRDPNGSSDTVENPCVRFNS
jgi:hypothetical protein